ncbi:MAG: TIR domain-containing protein [Thermoproteota archaeon]
MVSIFVSHSRNDKWFIDPLAQALRTMNVEPILLELETPVPYPLPEVIKNGIGRSSAVFVLITPNVADSQTTRENVLWEVAQTHALGKPIYVFKDRRSALPMMIPYVTTYHEFDMYDQQQVKSVFNRAVITAQEIAKQDAVNAVYWLFLAGLGALGLALFLPEKKKCPKCGYEVDEDAVYCPKCGCKF